MAEVTGGQVTDHGGAVQVTGSQVTENPGVVQVEAGEVNLETGKPTWLPEGFDSVADFQKAYDAMTEAKAKGDGVARLVEPGKETAAAGEDSLKAGEGDDTIAATKTDDEIKADLQKAGGIYADPRYEPFALEFEKTGALSEDSVKAAAAAFGVPENAVTDFVKGQQALRQAPVLEGQLTDAQSTQLRTQFLTDTGVKDWDGFSKWAGENLSPEDLKVYNEATDLKAVGPLVKAWNAQFEATTRTPRDITTAAQQDSRGAPADAPIVGYASAAEQMKDQRSPEYRNDPVFRRKVEQRIIASNY